MRAEKVAIGVRLLVGAVKLLLPAGGVASPKLVSLPMQPDWRRISSGLGFLPLSV